MDSLIELVSNPFLLAGVSGWLVAQVIKSVLYAIINRKFSFGRLFGDGGMPSAHSATVTSLALMVGMVQGFETVEFAIAAILAIIVCHDATGVRRETEKQAYLITELVNAFSELSDDKLPEVKLKRFVGHTPIQVMMGILVGVVNAVVLYGILE